MEVHGHECLHIGFETSTQIGDTGVNAIPERIEVVIVGAIQYLLFDESPQAFDQIQVGRIGRQVKEFDAYTPNAQVFGFDFMWKYSKKALNRPNSYPCASR